MAITNLPEHKASSDPEDMRTFVPGEVLPFLLGVVIAGCIAYFFVGPDKLLYCVLSVFGGTMLWGMLLLYRFINYLVYFFWYIHETTTPLMTALISAFGGPGKIAKDR